MESCVILLCLCDPCNYYSSNWHLLLEIEILFVTQLVQASPNRSIVTHLDKASGLADICDIPEDKISSVNH